MGVLRTPLCDLLGIEVPILGAPMGGVALADLAAAISEAGGLGIMGLAALGPEQIREEIRKARAQTSKPIGVGLLFPGDMPAEVPAEVPPLPDFLAPFLEQVRGLPSPPPDIPLTLDLVRAQMDVLIEERVDLIAAGLGILPWVVEAAHAAGIKVASLVGSVRAARKVELLGVDLIVAQGYEAGGHTGSTTTLVLVPQVVDAVRTPVVAAGGIADGRGVAAALALGAQGVLVGTRFLATPEARTAEAHKRRILEMSDDETVVTCCYTGKPARVIRNAFTDAWRGHEGAIRPMAEQRRMIDPIIRPAKAAGLIDIANWPTGQAAVLVHEIKPAAEVVAELANEAAAILASLASFARVQEAS